MGLRPRARFARARSSAIKGDVAAELDRTENKLMQNGKDHNTTLKLARFIHIMLRKAVLNSQK